MSDPSAFLTTTMPIFKVNINAIEIMPVSQSWAPFQVHRKQVS